MFDFGVGAGTPCIRRPARADRPALSIKLEHLLPSGSVYDRIAGPLIEQASGPEPFLVAGCGSACLSFAAASRRAGRPVELFYPAGTLEEHRLLLKQHRVKAMEVSSPSLLDATAHAEALAAAGSGHLLHAAGRPRLARLVWTATLVAELEAEHAGRPGRRPTVFLPSGLSDLAVALGPGFSTRLVSSAIHGAQDGAFAAAEHTHDAIVTDAEALAVRRRLATQDGLLLGYATCAAIHAAEQALRTGEVPDALVVALDAGDRYFSYDGRFPVSSEVET